MFHVGGEGAHHHVCIARTCVGQLWGLAHGPAWRAVSAIVLLISWCAMWCAVSQIEGTMDSIKTATATPVNPVESKAVKANEGFLQGEGGKQQLLLR